MPEEIVMHETKYYFARIRKRILKVTIFLQKIIRAHDLFGALSSLCATSLLSLFLVGGEELTVTCLLQCISTHLEGQPVKFFSRPFNPELLFIYSLPVDNSIHSVALAHVIAI